MRYMNPVRSEVRELVVGIALGLAISLGLLYLLQNRSQVTLIERDQSGGIIGIYNVPFPRFGSYIYTRAEPTVEMIKRRYIEEIPEITNKDTRPIKIKEPGIIP